jgi:hypothetical protein
MNNKLINKKGLQKLLGEAGIERAAEGSIKAIENEILKKTRELSLILRETMQITGRRTLTEGCVDLAIEKKQKQLNTSKDNFY